MLAARAPSAKIDELPIRDREDRVPHQWEEETAALREVRGETSATGSSLTYFDSTQHKSDRP